jgi:hypothetical protein
LSVAEAHARVFVLAGQDGSPGGEIGDALAGSLPTNILQFGPVQVAILDRAGP